MKAWGWDQAIDSVWYVSTIKSIGMIWLRTYSKNPSALCFIHRVIPRYLIQLSHNSFRIVFSLGHSLPHHFCLRDFMKIKETNQWRHLVEHLKDILRTNHIISIKFNTYKLGVRTYSKLTRWVHSRCNILPVLLRFDEKPQHNTTQSIFNLLFISKSSSEQHKNYGASIQQIIQWWPINAVVSI